MPWRISHRDLCAARAPAAHAAQERETTHTRAHEHVYVYTTLRTRARPPILTVSPYRALSDANAVVLSLTAAASQSSLILDGDITLHSLSLDGALSISACAGATVVVRDCSVSNSGWPFVSLEPGTPPKAVSIRGYHVAAREGGLTIEIREPGEYELSGSGELKRIT